MAGRTRDGPSVVIDDQALPDEGLPTFRPDPVAGRDYHRVAVCGPHAQDVGHGRQSVGLLLHRNPIRRDADDVRPLQGEKSPSLRKPPIIANQYTETTEGRMKHRKAEVATLEIEGLGVPQMILSIGSDGTIRTDNDGAVVEPHAVTLEEAGDQVHIPLRRRFYPGGNGGAGRRIFRQLEGLLAGGEDVSGIAELGQDDEIGARIGGAGDQRQAGRYVLFQFSDPRLELGTRYLRRSLRHGKPSPKGHPR